MVLGAVPKSEWFLDALVLSNQKRIGICCNADVKLCRRKELVMATHNAVAQWDASLKRCSLLLNGVWDSS